MAILRIQHPVTSYERWKVAFDRDPADRQGFRGGAPEPFLARGARRGSLVVPKTPLWGRSPG